MLIVEMYRNHLTETQQTETLIHHWAAEIDTALGISHNQTFLRREILQMVAPDQFVEARIFDLVDFSYDPRGKEITALFLLSTGDPGDLAEVRQDMQAHRTIPPSGSVLTNCYSASNRWVFISQPGW